jgi:hypothetical protein
MFSSLGLDHEMIIYLSTSLRHYIMIFIFFMSVDLIQVEEWYWEQRKRIYGIIAA